MFGCCQALGVPLSELDVVLPFLQIQITRTVFNEHAAVVSGLLLFPYKLFRQEERSHRRKRAAIHTRRASIACGWGFLAFLCVLEWKSSLILDIVVDG